MIFSMWGSTSYNYTDDQCLLLDFYAYPHTVVYYKFIDLYRLLYIIATHLSWNWFMAIKCCHYASHSSTLRPAKIRWKISFCRSTSFKFEHTFLVICQTQRRCLASGIRLLIVLHITPSPSVIIEVGIFPYIEVRKDVRSQQYVSYVSSTNSAQPNKPVALWLLHPTNTMSGFAYMLLLYVLFKMKISPKQL